MTRKREGEKRLREERVSEKTKRRYVFIMVTLETKNFHRNGVKL